MLRKPLTIGKTFYASQTAANEFIRELLHRHPLRTAIPEPDHSFLLALISRHPRAAEKVGAGVRHFTVEPAMHGTRCFYVNRVDGTKDDFCTSKCVRGRE